MLIRFFFFYSTIIFLLYGQLLAKDDFYQMVGEIMSASGLKTDRKCGFPTVLQASHPKNDQLHLKLDKWMAQTIQLDSVYVSPSGHFIIHYTTSGNDAIPKYDRNQNGTSDYLEFVAKAFDEAWRIEIDSLGFKAPPDSSGNPRSVYHIYCRKLSVYGSTLLLYEIPDLEWTNYVTEIEINTDFSYVNYPNARDEIVRDSMAIAVTAAHEFNHALQSGYRLWEADESGNYFEDIWFIESSATFMEEVVAPDVNDYLQYLPSYFRHLDRPLDKSEGGWVDYGKVLLLKLLGEEYGWDITRKIWEEIVHQRAMPAMEKILLDLNTDILSELSLLSVWIYFSGSRAIPGQFFDDADLFPQLRFCSINPVLNELDTLLEDSLPRLSMRWYLAQNESSSPMNYLLQKEKKDELNKLNIVFINPSGDYFPVPASVSFNFPVEFTVDTLAFGVITGNWLNEEMLRFSLLTKPLQFLSDNDDVHIYPQPLVLSKHHPSLTFSNLPEEATIHIFTANGLLLKSFMPPLGAHSYTWDLKTKSNQQVGSGIYLYRIVSPKGDKSGKFVVIK